MNIELETVLNGTKISVTSHDFFSRPIMIWLSGSDRDEDVDMTYEEAKIVHELLGNLLEKMEWEDEQPK